MGILEFIRSHAVVLPNLAKCALGMAIIVGAPPLSKKLRLPTVVVLLLCGVLIGPHVLGVLPVHHPIADFFAELGKLLLMFFAGLEIDLALFRRARNRSVIFGLLTTSIPLALGAAVGLWFGYQTVAAIVLGSLLASG
jgi:Kef-type K+ transport system membrane component KefB